MRRSDIEESIRDALPEADDTAVKALLDKIMDENGRDINRLKGTIESDKSEIERLTQIEKELDDYKKANMTAEEQLRQATEEAEAAKRDYGIKMNRLEIEQSFVEAGILKDDYAPLLDSIVTENAEASKASAAKLLDLLTKQKEAAVKATKEEMLKQTPAPSSNAGSQQNTNFQERFQAALDSNDLATAASLVRQNAEQSQIDTTSTN